MWEFLINESLRDGYCFLLYVILVFPRAITDSFNVFLRM